MTTTRLCLRKTIAEVARKKEGHIFLDDMNAVPLSSAKNGFRLVLADQQCKNNDSPAVAEHRPESILRSSRKKREIITNRIGHEITSKSDINLYGGGYVA